MHVDDYLMFPRTLCPGNHPSSGKWIPAERFNWVYSDLRLYRTDARYAGGKPNAEKEWTSFLALFLGFFGDSEYGRQLRAVVDEYDDRIGDWEEIGRRRATGGSLFGKSRGSVLHSTSHEY